MMIHPPLTSRRRPAPVPAPAGRPGARRAFSLIEILVVVGIIALLIGLGAFGFTAFRTEAQNRQTMGLLQNMQAIAVEYQVTTGRSYDPDDDPGCDLVDAPSDMNPHEFYLECFIRDAWDIPEVEPLVRQLDGFLRVRDGNELRHRTSGETPANVNMTVVDRWDEPLRYFYRATGDHAEYGVPPHHRPFFASAGPSPPPRNPDDCDEWGHYGELAKRLNDEPHHTQCANQAADNLFSFELD